MKRIVIVGASSGIGQALAEEYASRGFRVGVAARNMDALRTLYDKYPQLVEIEQIDINAGDAPDRLVKLIDRLGGMDIYLHVSGIGYDNPTLNPQREVDMITTNACGFARMISTAYRYYRDNSLTGQIVAITSVAGTNGIGALSAYSASKKCAQTYLVALEQLAHSEHANVCFTDIRPGWIRTPLLYDTKKYPLEMPLSKAVPMIVEAISRKRRVAVIGWRWKILVALWRCLPNALWTRMKFNVF